MYELFFLHDVEKTILLPQNNPEIDAFLSPLSFGTTFEQFRCVKKCAFDFSIPAPFENFNFLELEPFCIFKNSAPADKEI